MYHSLLKLSRRVRRAALLPLLAVVASGTLAYGQTAGFIPLGDLNGGPASAYNSVANGMAIGGGVVTGGGTPFSGNSGIAEAWRWPGSGALISIGDLAGGLTNASGAGVSGSGLTIVGFGSYASGTQAFEWSAGPGMVGLTFLAGGINSAAGGISSNGLRIVGRSDGTSTGPLGVATRWDAGTPTALGALPGAPSNSFANSTSHDGAVIVGGADSTATTLTEAFHWTSGPGMVGLGDLPGGLFFSEAKGVSADGLVVVGFGNTAAGQEAFRWTTGGGMVGLGDFAGGIDNSVAHAANADGSIVVGAGDNAFGTDAFYWTAANGMLNLSNLLTSLGVTTHLGWNLQEALAVSGDGLTVAGVGINPSGGLEAWVATVPEPSTVALAVLGGLGFGAMVIRRRRRQA